MRSFKEWTLSALDETFGLEQISPTPVLEAWLNGEAEISDVERQALMIFQKQLHLNVHDWNEHELTYNFIGPLMALAQYTTKEFNFFKECVL